MEAILTAPLLRRAGIRHGFTTRACGDVGESLAGWEGSSGLAAGRLLRLQQVHGSDVVVIDADNRERLLSVPPPADAAATALAGPVLSVLTADCVPVLLADPGRRVVAVAHAGWRGTLSGVLARLVSVLQEKFSCNPEELLAVMGPSIRPCCYQVGDDVFLPFRERFGSEAVMLAGSSQRVDLQAANRLVLTECGVPVENIAAVDLCTCCSSGFFSYRRQGRLAGRQLAFIAL